MMNNLRKVIAIVLAFTMISGALLVIIPSAGQSAEASTLLYPDQIAMCPEPEFRDRKATDLQPAGSLVAGSGESILVNNTPLNTTMPFVTSGTFWDETSSLYPGSDDAEWYDAFDLINITKRGEGEHCEVWVADDLSFYNGTSDPRDSLTEILDWQVNYIMDEFDNNIYPVMTETFIDAPALNGSNPDIWYWQYVFMNNSLTQDNITDMLFPTNDTGKMMIVIFNMIDENWYDGYLVDEHRVYTAGYYWSLIRGMYDRNVMHIDCFEWIDRIGDNVSRPYMYESTVAHEYQHLLHDEIDGGEESWINEGLSMMAEPLCGYPIPYLYVNEYLGNSTNSLMDWGDQGGEYILADYGAAYMFMQYLADHYGDLAMLQAIFNSMEHGVDGINEAFLTMGHNRMTFDRVFRDWRMANLALDLDIDIPGGLYYYNTLESDEIVDSIDISRSLVSSRGDQEGQVVGAYGTDYIHVTQGEGWSLGSYWYSGSENFLNTRLLLDLDLAWIDADSMVLDTMFDTEGYWDSVQVQVSTDGGNHWSTLYQSSGYYDGDLTIDLSDYKSREITVGFLYTMDGSVVDYGWDIYDITMVDDWFDTYYVDLEDLYVEDGFATADLEGKVFMFDGDDESPQSWMFDGMDEYWYSGDGDEIDRLLTMEVDLTAPAQEEGEYLHWLNLSTYWQIEDNWDFGFVQVSIDGGLTWTSLNDTGSYCTEVVDMGVMPSIAANVPGLTGESEGIVDLSFDLSAYDGQEILVGFRYMTDWASTYDGWFIFGMAVDGVEVDLMDMAPVFPEVDWIVTIYVPGTEYYTSMIIDISVDDLSEVGYKLMSTFLGYEEFYVLVSPNMGGVTYEYEVRDRGMNYYMLN